MVSTGPDCRRIPASAFIILFISIGALAGDYDRTFWRYAVAGCKAGNSSSIETIFRNNSECYTQVDSKNVTEYRKMTPVISPCVAGNYTFQVYRCESLCAGCTLTSTLVVSNADLNKMNDGTCNAGTVPGTYFKYTSVGSQATFGHPCIEILSRRSRRPPTLLEQFAPILLSKPAVRDHYKVVVKIQGVNYDLLNRSQAVLAAFKNVTAWEFAGIATANIEDVDIKLHKKGSLIVVATIFAAQGQTLYESDVKIPTNTALAEAVARVKGILSVADGATVKVDIGSQKKEGKRVVTQIKGVVLYKKGKTKGTQLRLIFKKGILASYTTRIASVSAALVFALLSLIPQR